MKWFNKIRHEIGLVILLSLFYSISNFAQTYVSDPEDLQDFVNAADPGEIFIVPNGTYNDFESTFTVIGTAENPIIIKAETIGGVILTGESHFVFKKAAHIILQGFVFDGQGEDTLVKLEGSHHIRITQNVFELETEESIKWVFVGGFWSDNTFEFESHHNRIDHNIFQNKNTTGHYITIDGSNDGDEDFRQSRHDRIDHNYFKNNGPRAANEQESIRIGWSEMSMSSGFTTVEFNLFEDCDGDPEIISVKSCDNTIRHNTFRGCYGTLSLRHGNRNHVEGNYFFGNDKPNGLFVNSNGSTSTIYTGGIRIYGTDHVIINNYMEGLKGTRWDAPIALTQGDAIDGSSTNFSKHFRAERVTIAYNTLVNNTHGIEIGFDNNGNYNKELKDITIANNLVMGAENSLVTYLDGNNNEGEISWSNNVFFPMGNASLTSDNSTFEEDQISLIDPILVYDGILWKSTANSPINENSLSSLVVEQDMEGQIRPDLSTVGADHFSSTDAFYRPLTSDDVGPNSDSFTSTEAADFAQFLVEIYPNPTADYLELKGITEDMEAVQLFTISGEKIWEQPLKKTSNFKLNINHFSNGFYIIRIIGENGQFAQKILIAK